MAFQENVGGQSGGGGEFWKQSGEFINNRVGQMYERCAITLSQAFQSHPQGFRGKQQENAFRRRGLAEFQALVSYTIKLGSVEQILMSFPEEKRGFKSVEDLCRKLATADVQLITSDDVYLKWWMTYAETLNHAGLIKIYTIEDMNSEFKKFRK